MAEKAGGGGRQIPQRGGIISEKAAYVRGGKGICGRDSMALDNPERWFFPSHLGTRGSAGGLGGGDAGGAAAIDAGVSPSQQPAGARSPQPTMPSSKSGSEFWIDGSHREAALEDFYVVGPELGRYRAGRANWEGRETPGVGAGPGWGGERAGGRQGGMEGSRGDAGMWGRGWMGGLEGFGGDGGMKGCRKGCRKGGTDIKGVGGMGEEGWKNGGMQEGMDTQGRWMDVEGPRKEGWEDG